MQDDKIPERDNSSTSVVDTSGRKCRTEHEIVSILREQLTDRTFKEIADHTGFHPESVRRYLAAQSRLPAAFLAACCGAFEIDPDHLLLEDSTRYVLIRIREDVVGDFEQALGRRVLESLRKGEAPMPVIVSRALTSAIDTASAAKQKSS